MMYPFLKYYADIYYNQLRISINLNMTKRSENTGSNYFERVDSTLKITDSLLCGCC